MAAEVAPRHQWQAFPPPRLPLFTGGDDGCHLDDFVTEARRIIAHFNLAALGGEAAEWLIQSLAGAARREINLRPPHETGTADLVLAILQNTFGDHISVTSLMLSFCRRCQSQEEGILDFAHGLQALQLKTNAAVPGTVKDLALRDRFICGMYLPALRQHLRLFVRQRESVSTVTFDAARTEALRWMREDADDVEKEEAALRDRSTGIKEVQVQVNALTAEAAGLLADLNQRLPAIPNPALGKWQRPSRSRPRCWVCGRNGHLQSQCPAERKVRQQPWSWRQPSEPCVRQQSATAKQPLHEQSSQTEQVAVAEVEQQTSNIEPVVEILEQRLKKEIKAKQRLQADQLQMKLDLYTLREQLEEMTQHQVKEEGDQHETSPASVEIPVVQTCESASGPLSLAPVPVSDSPPIPPPRRSRPVVAKPRWR